MVDSIEAVSMDPDRLDLKSARIIVSGGPGVGSKDNFVIIDADALGVPPSVRAAPPLTPDMCRRPIKWARPASR